VNALGGVEEDDVGVFERDVHKVLVHQRDGRAALVLAQIPLRLLL
jgi:hypothetical protein